jgi:outer membrane protein assembly factor BamD (BamD/ComL family)
LYFNPVVDGNQALLLGLPFLNAPTGNDWKQETMMNNGKTWLVALLLAAPLFPSHAQTSRMDSERGYASDGFEGFDAFDKDERLPQKEKSFWYSVDEKTAAAQLAFAAKLEASGKNKSARRANEALVREWPTAPEAAQAQLAEAQLFEKMGKYDRAFDEYQYLLTFFAGHCPYNEVLDRQFRIANLLLHGNKSMFGWILSGTDTIRGRFEKIVVNAPRSAIAPEVMLIIGSIRVSADEKQEAIAVYDGILNRFPGSQQAVSAAYLSAQCRYDLAVKHNYNEQRCRESIAFFKAVLARAPNHPQKEQMTAWLNELTHLQLEQNYQQAVFYDTRQRKPEAAKAAYRRFLSEFANSKYAPQVRARLTELEKSPAPANTPAK